jgi:glutathione S-transferase
MITLYGRPNSLCTQRVLWCLTEAGLPYELILASAIFGEEGHIWKGGAPYGVVDRPEYLLMNPNGTVPTLDDAGTHVWESNAILSYLALQYAPGLYLHDAKVFGRTSCWMGWCNSRFESPLGGATMHLSRLPPEQRDPSRLRVAEAEMVPILETIDRALQTADYIAGGTLTIGDIALAPFVQRWYYFGLARPEVPAIDAWFARLGKREGYQRHVVPKAFHIEAD